ncbi:DUF647-domain-containing protein [Eremomyces bilateralis CBS 781.70]|uniref:DUF647-domain-containing protein n=1 Tax=Eremomyces bilateralis CBS 781.70 TaxID=1392243 RepID=A0A6G1FWR7_9PEZI|nr:DUF647-domain-containing protein [Eremomyces bilateralis CBS 781.70]KAF1810214.1 DUF647-domain-containing protein [Eremomyces bilateralis CBS 781.70]
MGIGWVSYQIYDSLQAFSSSIAGMFASRAVLEGVGVGDAQASPTAALLLSVIQESVGRIATILFAHRVGTALEPECKMFRLAADVFNDTAMVLDCLSPAFPKTTRVLMLSMASVLRALCGVAAGSSKASLSAHFAKQGNLAELNAKDSSQETIISLLGMLAGSFVISRVTSHSAVWTSLLILISIHLWTNYMAVRSVILRTLNRQRANIVLSSLIGSSNLPSPQEASHLERIFERPGLLRWVDGRILGHCMIGVELSSILRQLPGAASRPSGKSRIYRYDLAPQKILGLFDKEFYVLWFDTRTRTAYIALKEGCQPRDQVRAWCHALLVARKYDLKGLEVPADQKTDYDAVPPALQLLAKTGDELSRNFHAYEDKLQSAGWDTTTIQLETRPRIRISLSE